MGFLSKFFGASGSTSGLDVETAVTTLSALYDDPEVVSERGIAINGRVPRRCAPWDDNCTKVGAKSACWPLAIVFGRSTIGPAPISKQSGPASLNGRSDPSGSVTAHRTAHVRLIILLT